MEILIITVLVAVSLAVLIYPFATRLAEHDRLQDPAEELAQQLRRSRDRVYEEIRALQQEYFLKSLTEEEYRAQLEEARLQAARLMREQQQAEETIAQIDATVEARMRASAGEEPEASSLPGDRS
ncbi:MAG: hypothetical protein V3S98_08725 [Dehalococcoidia bacterium]